VKGSFVAHLQERIVIYFHSAYHGQPLVKENLPHLMCKIKLIVVRSKSFKFLTSGDD